MYTREASGETKKLMGLNVPCWISMWTGGKGVFCGAGVCAMATGCGQSAAEDPLSGGWEALVAMMSIPVLSMPEKKSRPTGSKTRGMFALPIGTLPGGTIFRNVGAVGSPGPASAKWTAELSQVL